MRRANDFYPTPRSAARALYSMWSPPTIIEPCVGDGALLPENVGVEKVKTLWTNDIDPSRKADYHFDAAKPWPVEPPRDVAIVTNPPFSQAMGVLHESVSALWGIDDGNASLGSIALLLRLSFLEPTKDRGRFLSKYPPSVVIVLPRISFTGDGKTDSVTCAWMIWARSRPSQELIVLTREEMERA